MENLHVHRKKEMDGKKKKTKQKQNWQPNVGLLQQTEINSLVVKVVDTN